MIEESLYNIVILSNINPECKPHLSCSLQVILNFRPFVQQSSKVMTRWMNDGYNQPSWYFSITLATGSHLWLVAAPRNHMIAIRNFPCLLSLNSMGSCQEKMQDTGESLPIHTPKLLCAYTSYLHTPTYPPQTSPCLPTTRAPTHTLPEPRCAFLTLSHILPEFCHAFPTSCYSPSRQ